MEIENFPINEIYPYLRNPRHNEKAIDKVAESIQAFGFNQPIVVDKDNIIIVGHTRFEAAKKLGLESVPVLKRADLPEEKAKAYRLADNRTGEDAEWDIDLLLGELTNVGKEYTGFESEEIEKMLEKQTGGANKEPEVKFSEELMEANNYIVLTFRNEIDWLNAQTHFDLQTVASKRSNGKPWSQGIGRVVDGAKYLSKLNEDL